MATRRRGVTGQGSVFSRKDKSGKVIRWVGQLDLGYVETPQGRRRRYRTVTGASQKEVAERLDDLRQRHRTGTLPSAGTATVVAYLRTWLAGKARVRPSTRRSYRLWIDGHIAKDDIGNMKLEKLRAEHVEAMLRRRQVAGLSPQSAQHIRAVLRAALRQAVRRGLLARNAASDAEGPEVQRESVVPLTPDEAQRFIEAIRGDRLQALYSVALAMGLRRGEALGLRWTDIDLDTRELRVVQSLQRVEGKFTYGAPKTKLSRRAVSIPKAVVEPLRVHRARQIEERMRAGERWQDTGLVFTTTVGTPLEGTKVTKAFQAALERAGVRRIRFHDLRHSCASLLLAQGVPMRVVMELLGHSTITITANLYSHVGRSLLDDAARAMDRALGGPA